MTSTFYKISGLCSVNGTICANFVECIMRNNSMKESKNEGKDQAWL